MHLSSKPVLITVEIRYKSTPRMNPSLGLVARAMTYEEFDQLVADSDRNKSIVDLLINLLINSSTSETPPANCQCQ